MKMWQTRCYVALGITLALYNMSSAAEQSVVGRYVYDGDIAAQMDVRVRNGIAEILVNGGGRRSSGESSAGDCAIRATGSIMSGSVRAVFQPIESDTMDYDAVQANHEQRSLRVTFSDRAADITAIDIDGYCGVGVRLFGHYRKLK